MSNPIPVVFCFDKSYVDYSAVAMFSLLTNSNSPVKIHCIVSQSLDGGLGTIRRIAGKFGSEVQEHVVDDEAFDNWREIGHIKRASYYRLLIPDLVADSKAIYLDSDIIVRGDLAELYATDLGDRFLFAGVADMFNGADTKISRIQDDIYINAGVLVMDLDKLRQENFLQKCREINSKYMELLVWADQCLINKCAEGRKTAVDQRWNCLVLPQRIKGSDWQALLSTNDTRIIHFVNSTKPWAAWCNPRVAKFWWDYARQLDVPDLKPVGATNINQLLGLARILDADQDFEEAGKVKNRIIKILLGKLGHG